jgi:hypothetical protein
MVCEQHCKMVKRCCTIMVPEERVCRIPYTVCRTVTEECERVIPCKKCKMVQEEHICQVPYTVCKTIACEHTKLVPHTTCHMESYCVTQKVCRRVPVCVQECDPCCPPPVVAPPVVVPPAAEPSFTPPAPVPTPELMGVAK